MIIYKKQAGEEVLDNVKRKGKEIVKKGFAEIGEETNAETPIHANCGVPSCMSGNKQSGMKEKTGIPNCFATLATRILKSG